MSQKTAIQTLIAWGDEMLLKHPQKILSFGEVIDKAVELLQMEREQIEEAYYDGYMVRMYDSYVKTGKKDASYYFTSKYKKK